MSAPPAADSAREGPETRFGVWFQGTRIWRLAKLEFADEAFDLVLCHQTLHYVPEQARVLAELRRVLRPGGVLLLAESCREFVTRLWVRVFFRHAMHAQHTAEEYAALVHDAGLEIAALTTPDPWWSLRDLGLRDRLARRTHPADAPHTLVCVAACRPA